MIEFKDISSLTISELFQELGMADFTYLETSIFMEELEVYRQNIHRKIKELQHGKTTESLDKGE